MAGCSMFVNLIVYIEEAKKEETGKKGNSSNHQEFQVPKMEESWTL